jgi:uncharacterized protein (TIGR00661 family)
MKILYGVPGEGMGHATRSKVIVSHLLKNHDVRIVSSSRAFDFLNRQFPGRAYKIQGFNFVYKNGGVEEFKTFDKIFRHAPHDLIKNIGVYKKLNKEFTPDIVITDFETSACIYGQYLKIPVIDIDNIQVINRCKIDIPIPADIKNNFQLAKNICNAKVPGCDHFLLSTFFNPAVVKKDTILIPPIVRDEIIQAKTQVKNHIVVYQTSSSSQNLLNVLNAVEKETFYVYGLNMDDVRGNCILKTFSERGFIDDLASAKAVITNGGYSLISEAVYLKKAICAFPVVHQFEQYMNAAYIEKLNYGKHLKEFRADGIKAFIYDLDKYNESISHYTQDGNTETFSKIDELLAKFE